MWQFRGQTRPDFAIIPKSGQESVWDYPRPPRVSPDHRSVRVVYAGHVIAASSRCVRVLETASPPTFYIPATDIGWEALVEMPGSSVCEWKGVARYWGLSANPGLGVVGWSYPHPPPGFEAIRDHVSFYPAIVECYVDKERVRAQPGKFYGGWITGEIVGPFKGEPGTGHW